jgi:Protein kinase domain
MADVWEGYDVLLARSVAVKIPLSHLARQSRFQERFRREAVAAARLNHPNVVAVYDTGADGDDSYLVMELIRGPSLRKIMASNRRLLPERAVSVAAQVAGALEFAHRAGVVHRDIKPGNILLGPDGMVKVTDFGIAKAVLGSDLTETDTTLGTVRYFSPEQVEGRVIDGRSDVYSLGVVLYEMLCAHVPFAAETDVAVALMHVRERPDPPSSHAPVPAWLDEATLRCLAKDPAERFATAGELRRALLAGSAGAPAPSARRVPVGTPETEKRQTSKASVKAPRDRTGGVVVAGAGGTAIGETPTSVDLEAAGAPGPRDPTRTLEFRRGRRRGPMMAEAGAPAQDRGGHATTTRGDDAGGEWPPGWEDVDARWSALGSAGVPAAPTAPEPSVAGQRRLVPIIVVLLVLAGIGASLGLLAGTGHRPSSSGGQGATGTPVRIVSAQAFDPNGNDKDYADLAKLIDGNPETYWSTQIYYTQAFGNLKPGLGFVLVLASPQSLSRLTLLALKTGWDATVYVAPTPQPTLADWGRPAGSVTNAGQTSSVELKGARGGAVLVWFTHLGPDRVVQIGEAQLFS